jgi:hypothetical protein
MKYDEGYDKNCYFCKKEYTKKNNKEFGDVSCDGDVICNHCYIRFGEEWEKLKRNGREVI